MPTVAANKAVAAPITATHAKGEGRAIKEHVRAHDHVDAGGDHGGGMDQGGDRSGAFHGVRQPDVKGNLRGLAGSAEHQQQRNGGEESALHLGMLRDRGEDLAEAEGAKVGNHQEHRDEKAKIADAVKDERLLAGIRSRFTQEVKADQQVGGEAYALPADEHEQEVLRQHQRQHEKHEQIEVGEEAPVSLFVRHVADGVDVNEEAYAGDDQQHDQGQWIEQEGKIGAEGGGFDPGKGQPLDIRRR